MRTHEKFNADNSDVTIRSSDDVLFKLHRSNLSVTTGAFPGTEMSTNDEQVVLSETADVLEIVFDYVYPKRKPFTMENMDFHMLVKVAEAVEKYEVFPAMRFCERRLRENMEDNALDVLIHAIKHDRRNLINESSTNLVMGPVIPVIEKLPLECVVPWVKYHEASKSVFEIPESLVNARDTTQLHCQRGGTLARSTFCRSCCYYLTTWIMGLENGVEGSLGKTIRNYKGDDYTDCLSCTRGRCINLPAIQELLLQKIRAIGPFTSFLNPAETRDDESTES
ncbi:hypothetical protein CPC08DRAFT_815130 [Agrocybe pediades]|nr:hypothetical protein CPC08DRAFT_815130 [Agrocybe pediades]